MEFLATKWLWLYGGAILMFMEIMVPGFVIFFFGLAAVTVGAVLFVCPVSATWQTVLFTVFSIVYLCGLRQLMKGVFKGDTAEAKRVESDYVGRLGTVVEKIAADVPGRIMLGDAEWEAASDADIEAGVRVRVVDQRNLTLVVKAV